MVAHHATTWRHPASAVGSVFCSAPLVISRGAELEVVVFTPSIRTLGGLQQEIALMNRVCASTATASTDVSSPLTSIHPAIHESSISSNAVYCCATVHDPETLAALLVDDPSHAATLIAQLTTAQRLVQALEHVQWCERHGQAYSLDTVLAAWEQRATYNSTHPEPAPRTPYTTLAYCLTLDPLDAAVLLVALPLPERIAAAHEHAHWLCTRGLPRTLNDILDGWQALADQAETMRHNTPTVVQPSERSAT